MALQVSAGDVIGRDRESLHLEASRNRIRSIFGRTPGRKDERPEENGQRAKQRISTHLPGP